jgi:uncharacterized protein (DUF1697 family)
MAVYISLLRGINVAAQKSIKMTELKALYEDLGLGNVKTYIQSGNVIFSSDETSAALQPKIRDAITQKFGFSVELMVCSILDWRRLIAANPFTKDGDRDPKYMHLTLLDKIPDAKIMDALGEVKTGEAEEYAIVDDAVYFYAPSGYGITKLSNNFWEKKLKVNATTRNWNTVNKLLETAEALEAN